MKTCFHIAECSLSYAKIMQTSAMKTCFHIAECSLSYAKISKKMKEFSLFNHFYILILNRQERYVKSSLQIIQPIVFFRIFRPLK